MFARLNFRKLLLTLIILLARILPSYAGDISVPLLPKSVVQGKADVHNGPVDEAALRYYASLKQNARVDAEIRRLKLLHPDWSPPANLWTSKPGNPDDGPLWELLASGKIGELRAEIDARRAQNPNWVLSTDLEEKMQRKELRAAILDNARKKRWNEVVVSAVRWLPAGGTDVEVLWQIAEGYAHVRRTTEAQQVLEGILRTSTETAERIATLQRSLELLDMGVTERFIESGLRDASGKNEFDVIAIDITRARISAWLHDAPGKEITGPELAAFERFAAAASDPDQAALLAWYAFKRGDHAEALEQFKSAIAKGGDATVAHGLAHTLRKVKKLREAEEVAYAWREPSAANMILFIDVFAEQLTQDSNLIDAKRLARYADVTLQTSSGEGAQALGWYSYNSCQLDAASEWFKRGMAWMPKETTALGYALTLRRLKKTQEYIDIVNRYDGLFPKVVALMYPGELSQNDPCNRNLARSTSSNSSAPGLRSAQLASLDPLRAPAAAKQPTWSQVPMPSKLGRAITQDFAGPKRTEFPVAVLSENPYRSLSSYRTSNSKAAPDKWRPATAFPTPLDARRVFGVGPMPYERYGKPLTPGWNGIMQPSLSGDMALQAPRGTPWSTESAMAEALATRVTASPLLDQSSVSSNAPSSASRFHP